MGQMRGDRRRRRPSPGYGHGHCLVLDHKTVDSRQEPPDDDGLVLDARTSIEFLTMLAPAREEKVA